MDLVVKSEHLAEWNGRELRCAVGRNGFVGARIKKEGDGGTPIGRFVMREVFYRPDREKPPLTALPLLATRQNDAWCENPEDPDYNQLASLPHKMSDPLWREDHLYDIMVILGFNDDPVVAGKGSAIFLHIARPDFSPSAGCVHLAREDLLAVLREADEKSSVVVAPSP